MIISQEDQVLKELFYKAFLETGLILIGHGVIIRKRVAQLSKILGVFQMLSFVITPYKELGLPWNYSDLQFIWMGLGFMSRIYYPTELMGLPEIGITLVLFLYAALIFLQLLIFTKVLRVVRNGQLSTDHQSKFIRPFLIKAENVLRYILMELAFIPTLIFLSEIVPAIEKAGYSRTIGYLYYSGMVVLISLEITLDSMLLQKLNWNLNSDNILSIPRYILSVRFVYLAMILVTNEVTYKDHYLVFCSVLMGVGLYSLQKFVYIQPYYQLNLNMFESYKAMILFLAGFVLLILTFNEVGSQDDFSLTSVYLLTIIPSMIIISDFIKKRRHYILNITSVDTNINQFFLQLYHTSKVIVQESEDNESQNLNCVTDIEHIIKMHLTSSTKNGFMYLWTIYYKMHLGEWYDIHVLLSESRNIENGWEVGIYLQECRMEYLKCLKGNIEEWEAHSYMMFRQHLKAILKDDQKSCELLVDLFYELLSRNTDTSKLSAFVIKVIGHTRNTKDYYYRLLRIFERNARLLEYYAGYLDFVENTYACKDAYLRASKAREDQDIRSNYKEDIVNLFNSNNMILTVSLELKSLGKIKWVNNAGLLGYNDLELEKEEFTMLMPSKSVDKQQSFFAESRDIWTNRDSFNNSQKQFLMKRDGYMISVHSKKRLVNTDANKLIMIIGLRINYDGLETAYLTDDGRFIYRMVRDK
jgi:hypothetical protein